MVDLIESKGFGDLLTGSLNDEASMGVLRQMGFADSEKALISLRRMYDMIEEKQILLSVLVLLSKKLQSVPDAEKIIVEF